MKAEERSHNDKNKLRSSLDTQSLGLPKTLTVKKRLNALQKFDLNWKEFQHFVLRAFHLFNEPHFLVWTDIRAEEQNKMKFVPWQFISDWKCNMCGDCCKLYSVVIDLPEWLQIVKNFGIEKTAAGLDRFYIKRNVDGSCPFIYGFANANFCGLQNMKPGACKQWPFKVLFEPRFGDPNHAFYNYSNLKLFVYADSNCSGLRYGSPSWEFATMTIREFVELTMGKRQNQIKTTNFLRF